MANLVVNLTTSTINKTQIVEHSCENFLDWTI